MSRTSSPSNKAWHASRAPQRGVPTWFLWLDGAVAVAAVVLLTPFRYSEYKDLSRTLLLPDARLLEERYGWDGIVQIVDSPHTRYLPGLSLNFTGTLPPSQLVFTDAGAMTLVVDADDALANPDFLRMTPEAFSFALTQPAALAASLWRNGGSAPCACPLGCRRSRSSMTRETRVAAVARVVSAAFAVRTTAIASIRADARQLLEQTAEQFDVIAVSLLGAHGTSTAGAASLDPSFLLTLDGFSRLFQRLTPGGHAVVEHMGGESGAQRRAVDLALD